MKKFLILLCSIFLITSTFGAGANTYQAYALTEEETAWVEEARAALREILEKREVMALVYLSDEYDVRVDASYESDTVVTIRSGYTVFVQDVVMDDNYEAWVKVSLYQGGEEYTGYINRSNLACSDEVFLQWESDYGMNPGAVSMYSLEGEHRKADEIAQFPASYQEALSALAAAHPNWTFVKQVTNLDWRTVIDNELMDGRSLVYKSFPDYTKDGAYDNGNWFYATREILEYYMDPRNGLTEDGIFQFEQLTYNEECHTLDAVQKFLDNTFMHSNQDAPGTSMTYALIFWAVGAEEERQVSPFHLVARVLQEQGNGTSPLISGNYEGAGGIYKGYYNYFNVKASGTTTTQVIESGLDYARKAGWDTAYTSIMGGADVISINYIQKGQDTLYLQKYNVGPDGHYAHYTHQYMQNIAAPVSEAKSMRKLYAGANSLDSTFVFKIPVFENMPEKACPMPTESTSVSLQIPEGYDATVYLDGVPYEASNHSGSYVVKAADKNAKSAVVFKYNESNVPVGMYVWTLEYANGKYVATAQTGLTDLLSYHGASLRVKGQAGIRCKAGIATATRNALLSTGIDGYTLKEYGTLIMEDGNRGAYPMIKDGEKVVSGMSYGITANGVLVDNVFETVDGRTRYTGVLVGLPTERYKTKYAFGSYAVLEKNGVSTTIYGPVVAWSMYDLATRVLSMNVYETGSAEDTFLRELIAAADGVQ